MIYGIGTDICSIKRIENVLQKHGTRFIKRICTEQEYTEDPTTLAKLWASKEAISKALGSGIGKKLSFQDIQITRQKNQPPTVTLLRAQPASHISHLKIHLSYSQEENTIIAFAIAEEIG